MGDLGKDKGRVVLVDEIHNLHLKSLLGTIGANRGQAPQTLGKLSINWRLTNTVETLKFTSAASKW